MAVQTVVKTIGATGTYSTLQLWEDGGPASYTTSEKSNAGTFAIASFTQGETINFVGSGATGKFLHTDSTGPGTGTYLIYGLTGGNVATSDVATGATSGATCIISSGTPTDTGVIWQGQQQNEELSGTGVRLTFGGATTSSSAYPHLTTVAGASHRDNASRQTNRLFYDSTQGASIRGTSASTRTIESTDDNVRISNLQIAATGAGSTALDSSANAGFIGQFLICEGTYTGTDSTLGAAACRGTWKDCCLILRTSGADHIVGLANNVAVNFYNCTFAAADDLATAPVSIFRSGVTAGSTCIVHNGAAFGGSTGTLWEQGATVYTITTCYTDINSPPAGATQVTYSSQFQNVNDATRDFRAKTGADLIDTATTDTTNAAIDIAGTARPSGAAYDVGCWELVSSGIIPILMRQYRERRA